MRYNSNQMVDIPRRLSRREAIQYGLLAAGSTLLAACSPRNPNKAPAKSQNEIGVGATPASAAAVVTTELELPLFPDHAVVAGRTASESLVEEMVVGVRPVAMETLLQDPIFGLPFSSTDVAVTLFVPVRLGPPVALQNYENLISSKIGVIVNAYAKSRNLTSGRSLMGVIPADNAFWEIRNSINTQSNNDPTFRGLMADKMAELWVKAMLARIRSIDDLRTVALTDDQIKKAIGYRPFTVQNIDLAAYQRRVGP